MAATEHIRERSRDRHRERSKERVKKRERSRSRDRDSKRSRRSPVPENGKDSRRGHRSRSRERERSKRDGSPDRSKPLDFAARQAARGDRDDKGTGKPDRDAARSSKHSRSDSRDVKPSRPSRERDTADRHRRESDRERPHENGRARSRDRHTDNKPEQSDLPGPPAENGAASATVKKAEPLSLEELLRKKQEEQAELAKPKFLSKKEREELALKRRQQEVELQKAKQAQLQQGHEEYQSVARRQQREQDQGQRRRNDQARERDTERKGREEERERQQMTDMIKKQYLGGEKLKKKMLKPSEKFKFNFDWEAGDDTSKDLNPLYNNTHEAQLLFGRGLRAGVDRREQKKLAAEHEKAMLTKIRQSQGIIETKEDRERDKERKRVADKFEDMRKERHWSEKKRSEMTERDWRIFREDFNIAYKGGQSGLPIRNWEEANLPEPLMKAIEKQGYKKPSPIQMAAIPLGLLQRDVIGIAETGSGKTAAFTLPMLVYIMKQPVMTEEIAAEGPYAVVMAPTRELTQQIEEEAVKMAANTDYRIVSVVGGQSIEDQGFKLRKGCEIIIATPGRLGDCLEKSYAVLNQCNYVVLDEADRMIDMGFEPQVMAVLDAMPSANLKPEGEDAELVSNKVYRTTYMFSATMPPQVERLARKYLRRPVVVNIGSAGRATDNVTQRVMMVKENQKHAMLDSELSYVEDKRVIVFVNTKKQCDNVFRHLEPQGYSCTVLHGGKDQTQREQGLAGFREEKYTVLIATDVAGRGIDVPDVALVINYDMPATVEAYTHRIGRTGRAGRKGAAITFLTLQDSDVFFDLKKLLEESHAQVPRELASHEAAKAKPGDRPRRDQTVYAKH